MQKAILTVGAPYLIGYQTTYKVVDVVIKIPNQGQFMTTLLESQATPVTLERMREEGEAHIIQTIKQYSLTRQDLVQASETMPVIQP